MSFLQVKEIQFDADHLVLSLLYETEGFSLIKLKCGDNKLLMDYELHSWNGSVDVSRHRILKCEDDETNELIVSVLLIDDCGNQAVLSNNCEDASNRYSLQIQNVQKRKYPMKGKLIDVVSCRLLHSDVHRSWLCVNDTGTVCSTSAATVLV